MVVKGGGGERYTLNSKNKKIYRTYTDYPIGNGKYVARILNRRQRNHSIEDEIELAVKNGSYFEDEQPLNILYMGKKFIGFLYEGKEIFSETINRDSEEEIVSKTGKHLPQVQGKSEQIYIIGVQVVMAVLMAIIGIKVIYPILGRFMNEYQESSVINLLHYLDYKGIPAIIAGLILQIAFFSSSKVRINNVIYSGLVAMLVNLVGVVLWTLFVLILMVVVQGAVDFIIKYIVYIILIIAAIIWAKNKFRIR